jgi:hypothetical protein
MSFLFDTSPQEQTTKKRRHRDAAEPRETEERYVGPPVRLSAKPAIGRLDGEAFCVDSRCQAQCHDVVEESRGYWFIECVFCGTGQWVPAMTAEPEGQKTPSDEEFRFPDGSRYAGLTIIEVVENHPGCLEWLNYAAKSSPDEAVRKSCETYLASLENTR